ncbi:MAG: hypothetical protein ABIG60_04940 [Patescibacteria group bacterium]
MKNFIFKVHKSNKPLSLEEVKRLKSFEVIDRVGAKNKNTNAKQAQKDIAEALKVVAGRVI